jgi:pentatricopeptide repeat protein
LAMSGRHPWAMTALALALADWGRVSEADAVYCEMQARARRQHVPPALLAIVASAAAREDEAIRHALEAYEIRDPSCQNFFSRYSPWAGRLYGYARFRELIAQMGRSEWLHDPLPPRAIPGATYAGITS